MSLREKIDAIVYDAIAYGPPPEKSGPITDAILAAIEAERPAIEAAERERLANLADKMNYYVGLCDDTGDWCSGPVSEWIRAQS